jgi:hypothetical protein
MKKTLILTLCSALIFGTMNVSAMEPKETTDSTFIVIKGENNIKAYEKAGIIKACTTVTVNSTKLEGSSRLNSEIHTLSSKPSKTWDLKEKSRKFDYSFKSYVYSDYKYLPEKDSISSTGYAIYHKFNPDKAQEMKIYNYDEDGDYVTSTTLELDDTTAWGLAV